MRPSPLNPRRGFIGRKFHQPLVDMSGVVREVRVVELHVVVPSNSPRLRNLSRTN